MEGGHATGLPLAFRSTLDPSRPNAAGATSGRGTETAGFFGPSSERSTRKVVERHLEWSVFWCFFFLGCDIGGAKELGVIYFPTNWGAKEPQNLPNHRVVLVCFVFFVNV